MKYAVLQSSLEIPDVEKLKRAFRSVRTLTDLDAHTLGSDAFGILVKGKSASDASTLVNALRSEGIGAEMVVENSLPPLPAAKFVRKLAFAPGALILHDPLGRPFELPGEHITLIAAGNVRVTEFNQVRTVTRVPSYDGHGSSEDYERVDYSTKEQNRFTFLLEIIVAKGALRYSVTVDKSVLFQALGDAFLPQLDQSFRAMTEKIMAVAPGVAVNRGAYYMRENAGQIFSYPTKNAFHEEIIWLLWQMQRKG